MQKNKYLDNKGNYKNTSLNSKKGKNRGHLMKYITCLIGVVSIGLGTFLFTDKYRDKLLDYYKANIKGMTLENMTLDKFELSSEELDYVYEILSDPIYGYEYVCNEGIDRWKTDYNGLARTVNEKYWGGKNVRTGFTVKRVLILSQP